MSANDQSNSSTNNSSKSRQAHRVGKYIVEIDRSKCISVANCVAITPDVFELDEEQIAVFLEPNAETGKYESDDDTVLMSARSCPTQAIIIKDAETGEQIFP